MGTGFIKTHKYDARVTYSFLRVRVGKWGGAGGIVYVYGKRGLSSKTLFLRKKVP